MNLVKEMDTRPHFRVGHFAAWLAIAAALSAAPGCTSALATAAWLVNGNSGPVDYKGLRDKKVAVVCRPMVSLQYQNQSVAREIAHQVGLLLGQNVRKLTLVDQRKVEQWMDENNWDEYVEVGKAMKADAVVGIDLNEFSIYSGQTVFQGKATASLKVYDCQTAEVLYEKSLPQVMYPPNHVIPSADVQENDFRKKFVGVLAEHLARPFYAHDRHADMGLDSQAFDF
jgi:uncharacterized protein YbjQ (UPF0145 family)